MNQYTISQFHPARQEFDRAQVSFRRGPNGQELHVYAHDDEACATELLSLDHAFLESREGALLVEGLVIPAEPRGARKSALLLLLPPDLDPEAQAEARASLYFEIHGTFAAGEGA